MFKYILCCCSALKNLISLQFIIFHYTEFDCCWIDLKVVAAGVVFIVGKGTVRVFNFSQILSDRYFHEKPFLYISVRSMPNSTITANFLMLGTFHLQ